jgi:hypothetical protein
MLINYESYMPAGSSIVDKTIGEIENEFSIKVDHYHNSRIEINSRIPSSPNTIIRPGMAIKICNIDSKVLARLRRYFDLP